MPAESAVTGSSSDAGGLPPTAGTPRGCVVVRLRTSGVEKSPDEIPIGPLRSRGPADRIRRGVAPSAFRASAAFAAARAASFDAREESSGAFDTDRQPCEFPDVVATRPTPTPIFVDAPLTSASSTTRPGSNTAMVVDPR